MANAVAREQECEAATKLATVGALRRVKARAMNTVAREGVSDAATKLAAADALRKRNDLHAQFQRSALDRVQDPGSLHGCALCDMSQYTCESSRIATLKAMLENEVWIRDKVQ